MRIAHAAWLIAFCILSPGCALFEDATHNAWFGVTSQVGAHREKHRNRQWAEQAWQAACMTLDGELRNGDYADGFKDGYAEYLFRGGDGEPPLVAPAHYRHYRYQTSQGYQAVEHWFAGYRHGASAARASGARRLITGPSSLDSEMHDVDVFDAAHGPVMFPNTAGPVTAAPRKDVPKATTLPDSVHMPPAQNEPPLRMTPTFSNIEAPNAPPEPARNEPEGLRRMPPGAAEPAPEKMEGAGVTIINTPPSSPERVRINNVNEVPPPAPEPVRINNVNEAPPAAPERVKINNVNEAPPSAPERAETKDANDAPPSTPERIRINNITVTPAKDK